MLQSFTPFQREGKDWRLVFKHWLRRVLHPHTRISNTVSVTAVNLEYVSMVPSPASRGRPEPIFHQFSSLPIELRLQIWELALFTSPRVVEFREVLSTDPSGPHTPGVVRSLDHLLLSTPIPLSMKICPETRTFALSRYIFSTGNMKLYLDPKIDTLCFGELACRHTLQIFMLCAPEADMRRLERLIVKEKFIETLARPVWTGSGVLSYEKPFKRLSGLSDLMLLPTVSNRGESPLGVLSYDKNCEMCRKIKDWKGLHGWTFPTYKEFVRMVHNGVENESAEKAYEDILDSKTVNGTRDWFRIYVKKVVLKGREDVVVFPPMRFRACQVAELHRFIDVKEC